MSKKQVKDLREERGKYKRALGLDRSRAGGGAIELIRDLCVSLVLVRHSS